MWLDVDVLKGISEEVANPFDISFININTYLSDG